jgi:cytochrome c553
MANPLRRFANALPLTLGLVLLATAGVALAGEPATPLGKWMKPNIGTALAGQDFATLKTNLTLVAGKVPSADYAKWADISSAGAAAAGKQDLAGVKASCKACHDAYKEKYKKEFVARPFP